MGKVWILLRKDNTTIRSASNVLSPRLYKPLKPDQMINHRIIIAIQWELSFNGNHDKTVMLQSYYVRYHYSTRMPVQQWHPISVLSILIASFIGNSWKQWYLVTALPNYDIISKQEALSNSNILLQHYQCVKWSQNLIFLPITSWTGKRDSKSQCMYNCKNIDMNPKIFRCGWHTTTKRPGKISTCWIPEKNNRTIYIYKKIENCGLLHIHAVEKHNLP